MNRHRAKKRRAGIKLDPSVTPESLVALATELGIETHQEPHGVRLDASMSDPRMKALLRWAQNRHEDQAG